MIVGLSSPTYDINGGVLIDALASSNVDAMERRVSRVKTLDGGVAVSDGGFSHGDRTITIAWKIANAAEYDAVRYLVQNYAQIRISLRDGVFLGVPYGVSQSAGEGRLELWLIESLSG